MKKVFLFFILYTLHSILYPSSVSSQAQMRSLWASAPESVVPLLTENNRLDMIDFLDNNMEAKVRNIFEGFSILDTLTTDFLRCRLTEKTDLQMRLLPLGNNDTIIAVVNTSRTPVAVSRIDFYTSDWQPAKVSFPMPAYTAFIDSCSAQVLAEIADLPLIEMSLSPSQQSLTLTLSDQPLSRDSRRSLAGRLHPITLFWNNGRWEQVITNN